jgi:hypothetical protein
MPSTSTTSSLFKSPMAFLMFSSSSWTSLLVAHLHTQLSQRISGAPHVTGTGQYDDFFSHSDRLFGAIEASHNRKGNSQINMQLI